MKAKLIACLVLFLSFSLVSWSQPPGNRAEQSAVSDSQGPPALPPCFYHETDSRIMAGRSHDETTRPHEFALSVTDNPLQAAFYDVTCLLASNF
jgi:hypothetical protein